MGREERGGRGRLTPVGSLALMPYEQRESIFFEGGKLPSGGRKEAVGKRGFDLRTK